MNIENLELFKERKIRAKKIFEIREISKKDAKDIVKKHHYLGEKDFMYTVAYGLFDKTDNELLGSAIFGVVGGALALKSWFGVDNSHSNEYFELTRLVMNPQLNGCNATSFLLGNAISEIGKNYKNIKAIVSLADNSLHNGYIYKICNFKYYGLTNKKTDFIQEGLGYPPKRCGSTKDKHGVWLPRSQKHRYCYIIDKNVEITFEEQKYPKGNDMNVKPTCCDGTHEVYDKRFKEWYSCPKCVGIANKIDK
ncbi:MAG: hypothetical protein RR359_02845 [Bacilli bacterium]